MSVVEYVTGTGPIYENVIHEDVGERVLTKPVYEHVTRVEHVVETEHSPTYGEAAPSIPELYNQTTPPTPEPSLYLRRDPVTKRLYLGGTSIG